MSLYPKLRTIHLLCGAFSLPMLLMYGVSAVQMAHPKWFTMKPAVTESSFALPSGFTDGRALAREVMAERGIRGEITGVQSTSAGFDVRIVVPGMVHEIRYDRSAGSAHLRTSVAGFMGMLNRLHHAAGLSRGYVPLQLWGTLAALVSLATVGLGLTGLWMWWLRKQERTWGLILLAANVAFAAVILIQLRSAGP